MDCPQEVAIKFTVEDLEVIERLTCYVRELRDRIAYLEDLHEIRPPVSVAEMDIRNN